jgi:hypothetical protein
VKFDVTAYAPVGDDVIIQDSRFVCLCASVSTHFDVKSDVTHIWTLSLERKMKIEFSTFYSNFLGVLTSDLDFSQLLHRNQPFIYNFYPFATPPFKVDHYQAWHRGLLKHWRVLICEVNASCLEERDIWKLGPLILLGESSQSSMLTSAKSDELLLVFRWVTIATKLLIYY